MFKALLFSILALASTRFISGDAIRSSDRNSTWTIPMGSDQLVGRTAAQTLTNKTIDGNLNTITNVTFTNIPIANIAAMAANSLVFTDPNGKLVAGGTIGDVIINGNSTATIQPAVVSNSKLATMANSTIKCNISGGTASPSDCTGGQIGTVVGALLKSNNLSDLASATTAQTNLGLTSSATVAVPPTAGSVIVSNGTAWVGSTIAAPACAAISASDVDWSLGNCFTKTLSANTTFTFSKRVAGQTIVIRIKNPATYTWTMPSTNSQGNSVLWSSSTIPTASTGNKKDIVTVFFDGSEMFGNAVASFGGF